MLSTSKRHLTAQSARTGAPAVPHKVHERRRFWNVGPLIVVPGQDRVRHLLTPSFRRSHARSAARFACGRQTQYARKAAWLLTHRAVASFQHRPFSSRRAAPLLWLRSPNPCSRLRLRLPLLRSLTRQQRLKRCRVGWRAHSAVRARRPHFVAPSLRFRMSRLGSSHKRSCVGRRLTPGGADRPEETCHNQPSWRPAAHKTLGLADHLTG